MLTHVASVESLGLGENVRGEILERKAIDLEHLGCKEEALQLYETLLRGQIAGPLRLACERAAIRLAKPPRRWKPPQFPALREAPEATLKAAPHVVLLEDGTRGQEGWVAPGKGGERGVGVEALALHHYKAKGYDGFHSEGAWAFALFALLGWELGALFDASRNAFPTPVCDFPVTVAKEAYEEMLGRLRGMGAAELRSAVARRWDASEGTQCRGIAWDFLPREFLAQTAGACGGKALAAIFEDVIANGLSFGGMPDLCLWHPKEKRLKMVEIKGPNDTLSFRQRYMLDKLLGLGVDSSVLHVTAR